jgi:hypothetical protein
MSMVTQNVWHCVSEMVLTFRQFVGFDLSRCHNALVITATTATYLRLLIIVGLAKLSKTHKGYLHTHFMHAAHALIWRIEGK